MSFQLLRPRLLRASAVAAVLATSAVVATAQQIGVAADPLGDPRVLQPAELSGFLAAGAREVPIIVNLAVPDELRSFSAWRDPILSELHRQTIAMLQDAVLVTLSASEFRVLHQLENQATFSGFATERGLAELLAGPLVESIQWDRPVDAHTDQGITLMNADAVRSLYDGTGVSIAIVDTGVDYSHAALGGGGFPNAKVIGGHDFGDLDSDPMDVHGHGTSVAGVAGGDVLTNGDYIGGVAPGARIYAMKIVQGGGGSAPSSAIYSSWDWCITHQDDDPANPILVINTSFGGGQYLSACDGSDPSGATSAANCVAAGITLFVSSGNDGYCDSVSSPSCISDAISVGAVYDAALGSVGFCISSASCIGSSNGGCTSGWACFDDTSQADDVTCYSNSASFMDILAPSNNAWTPAVGGGYTSSFGGTSAAAPYSAGAAALILNAAAVQGVSLTPADLRSTMIATGAPILDDKSGITKPRVDVGLAVDSFTPPVAWVDFAYVGPESGTEAEPFNTLAEAVAAVPDGGTVTVKTGSTAETPTIAKFLTLTADGGPVTIGL